MVKSMNIKKQISLLQESLKDYPNVKIIAAAKYMDNEQTKTLVENGIKDIGENRTDIFLEKYEALKGLGITWHFFGCLQPRKVRDVANKIDCLHTLDKLALAIELNKRLDKPLDCFVQVNVTEEPSRAGVPYSKVKSFIKSLEKYPNIHVVGLMCIGKLTYDTEILEEEFKKMKELQEEIEELYYDHAPCTRLSMGMSNDYKIALKYGTTDIRIGRIFIE